MTCAWRLWYVSTHKAVGFIQKCSKHFCGVPKMHSLKLHIHTYILVDDYDDDGGDDDIDITATTIINNNNDNTINNKFIHTRSHNDFANFTHGYRYFQIQL